MSPFFTPFNSMDQLNSICLFENNDKVGYVPSLKVN